MSKIAIGATLQQGDIAMGDMEDVFGDVIYSYSRKQAIEDGVLVDLSTLYPSGTRIYKWPVACTDSVWHLIQNACGQDSTKAGGWVWDLCFMSAKFPIRCLSESEQLFRIIIGEKTHTLKVHCGPGDTAEPVITIMMPEED